MMRLGSDPVDFHGAHPFDVGWTLIPSAVEIRFTPLDSDGQWQVDDVYVDPFRRG